MQLRMEKLIRTGRWLIDQKGVLLNLQLLLLCSILLWLGLPSPIKQELLLQFFHLDTLGFLQKKQELLVYGPV